MALLHGLADLLFPPACQICRIPGEFPLCAACRAGFRLIHAPVCQKCGKPLRGPPDLIFTCIPCRHRRTYFRQARAAGVYDGSLREAIHSFKFGRRRALAEPLGRLMAEVAAADAMLSAAQLVVPIPLHPRRLRERGFNQAELLAAAVSKRLGVPMAADVLTRTRSTEAQSGLTQDERRANVRGAFAATCQIDAARVLLVDDVLSTGFTASECARQLRQHGGVGEVRVLAAAMPVLT